MRAPAPLLALCTVAVLAFAACDKGDAGTHEAKPDEGKSNAVTPPGPADSAGSGAPKVNVQMGADAKVTTDDRGTVVRDGAGNEVQTNEHGTVVKGADGSQIVTDDKGNVMIQAGGKSVSVDAEGNVKLE